jgi:predicted ABC-type sugar transport system permease subunit
MSRPAEITTVAVAAPAAVLVGLGVPEGVAAGLVLAVGLLPTAVTYLVTHGGVTGAARALWRGRS